MAKPFSHSDRVGSFKLDVEEFYSTDDENGSPGSPSPIDGAALGATIEGEILG